MINKQVESFIKEFKTRNIDRISAYLDEWGTLYIIALVFCMRNNQMYCTVQLTNFYGEPNILEELANKALHIVPSLKPVFTIWHAQWCGEITITIIANMTDELFKQILNIHHAYNTTATIIDDRKEKSLLLAYELLQHISVQYIIYITPIQDIELWNP